MAYLTAGQVQQWLDGTKLDVTTIDLELEASVVDRVLARFASLYDTDIWVDDQTTPSLVLQAVSMLYAAVIYNRQYSEDAEHSNWWADKLEAWAETLITGIVGGTVELPDVVVVDITAGQPVFWPNNSTGVLEPESAAKFTMAMEF